MRRFDSVDYVDGAGGFRFVGSRLPNAVSIWGDQPLTVDLRMRGGDDVVATYSDTLSGPVRGGAGRDRLVTSTRTEVLVNLAARRWRVEERAAAPVTGIEDVTATSATVRVRGSSRPNRLETHACRGVVNGGGGDDTLSLRRTGSNHVATCDDRVGLVARGGRGDDLLRLRSTSTSTHPGARLLRGGPGADVLVGDRFDNRLVGGAGRDRADGREGTDVCRTEVRRRCEAR